jgi:hypothetical protein
MCRVFCANFGFGVLELSAVTIATTSSTPLVEEASSERTVGMTIPFPVPRSAVPVRRENVVFRRRYRMARGPAFGVVLSG